MGMVRGFRWACMMGMSSWTLLIGLLTLACRIQRAKNEKGTPLSSSGVDSCSGPIHDKNLTCRLNYRDFESYFHRYFLRPTSIATSCVLLPSLLLESYFHRYFFFKPPLTFSSLCTSLAHSAERRQGWQFQASASATYHSQLYLHHEGWQKVSR